MNWISISRRFHFDLLILIVFSHPMLGQTTGGAASASPALFLQPAGAASETVVLSTNNQKITSFEFTQMLANLPLQQRRQFSSPGGRRAFAEYLGRLLVLAEAAGKEKLDQRPDVSAQLRLARMQLLAFVEQQAIQNRATVTETDAKNFYEKFKDRFIQLHLLHISVSLATEETSAEENERIRKEMEALRQRALKGEDFQKLAREFSKDSDAGKGGDLGFIGRGKFGEAMDGIVFNLKPGEVSKVFEAPGSIHLFKALAERPQPLTDAREAIVDLLRTQLLQLSVASLMNEMPMSVNEDYLKDENGGAIFTAAPTVRVEKDGKPIGGEISLAPAPPAKEKKK